MRKNTAWITIIYIIIFVLLTGCAINNDGTSGSSSTSIIDTDNDTTASLTLSEEDRRSEQSKRDYQDAYDAIRERFGLWPINKMNMDQYVIYGWQCSVDDPELYIKCNDVSKLLGIYQNSYHYQ